MSDYLLRPLAKSDRLFLSAMLYHALYVPPDGLPFPPQIICEPEIYRYVANWGKPHDSGFVAVDIVNEQPFGAVWMRLFPAAEKGYGYVSDDIPELSIALLSGYRNQGIGTALLNCLLEEARQHYAALSLSVSADNPALRLYQRLGFEVIDQNSNSLTMIKRFR